VNQKDIDRFWSKVDTTGECWLWRGTVSNGHAVISIGKGPRYAIRIAWELVRGTPPQPRINLRRTCDNPLCIKPDHRQPFVKQPKINIEKAAKETVDFSHFPKAATYYILNLVNHRIYVGRTTDMPFRLHTHLTLLRSKRHHSSALQTDWNIYGESAFEFGLLIEGCYTNDANRMHNRYRFGKEQETYEDIFVRTYQSDDPRYGYNIGHFQQYGVTNAARIERLAAYWNVGGARHANEVIRRCIDYTYQQLFGIEAQP
jgi:hypothetical protein